MITLISHF